jgi:crotonobetainyl-CoA:carnitine CoA-transferase CaiB-like acyl-CoA transferase
MERLGLGYESLSKDNPRLIYAEASGYGAESPYRQLPGQDLLLQATAGLAAVTGSRQGPPVAAGAAVVDQHAAALLAMGVLAALNGRHATGEGQRVEVTMIEAALDLQSEPLTYHLNGATVERPTVPLASSFHEAPYGFYEVKDGYVALSLSPMAVISEALGSPPELEPYLDPAVRLTQREEIYTALAPLLTRFGQQELIDHFREHGIWCAPVNDYDAMMQDKAIDYLEPVMTLQHPTAGEVKLLRHPIRYAASPATVRRMPPELGEHSVEIMEELGLQPEEIRSLQDAGAVSPQNVS